MAMDAEFYTIEVHGVPGGLPEDRMIDKLTMHFLRPRNGGGEVQRVLYSSGTPNQAFVIFERPDVAARVLKRDHALELEGRFFPLRVSRGERAEVDLPVRTTLDLRKFQNEEDVLSILRAYRFKVSRQSSTQLLLEGTFLNLSAARAKLGELLDSEDQSQSFHTEPRPSIHSVGAASKQRGSSDADASHRLNGTTMHAGSWSPGDAAPSSTYSSSVAPPCRRSETQAVSSAAGEAGRLSGSPRQDRASFEVDAHVLRYARTFRGDKVEDILRVSRARMDVKVVEGAGISTVVLEGHNAPLAQDELARFLTQVQTDLRTQEIQLSSMSREKRSQVIDRAHKFSSLFKVLVLQEGDNLQLVGSSSESYEMKQRILGEEVSQRAVARREGRERERGSQARRSFSLPRQPSRGTAVDSEPRSLEAARYSPPKYDAGMAGGGSRHGAGVGVGAGAVASTPPADPRTKRSGSESRAKAREGKPAPGHGGVERLPPAGDQRTAEKGQPSKKTKPPFINKPLMLLESLKPKNRRSKKSDFPSATAL